MINFENASFTELKPVSNTAYSTAIEPQFIRGESILATFQNALDGVVFTSKRVFVIRKVNTVEDQIGNTDDTSDIAGDRISNAVELKEYSSLPYSKILAYSVETSGSIDLDSELELVFSDLGKVKFDFVGHAGIAEICRAISKHLL